MFGTVVYVPDPNKRPDEVIKTWFRTRTTDGTQFLEEVLSGRRCWYRPNMLGRKSGLWALKSDVSRYFQLRRRSGKEWDIVRN